MAAVNTGDFDSARLHLKNALEANPGDAEMHFLNAKVAIELGNPELAKAELTPLLSHAKFGGEARTLLAQAYLVSGNAKLALETLGAPPYKSGAACAIAADSHFSLGNNPAGLDIIAKGLAAYPDSVELLQIDAQASLAMGDMARAHEDLARALKIAPADIHVLLLAGRISLIDGDVAKADGYFDSVLEHQKSNPVALMAKAAIAHDRGDKAKAQEYLDRAARSNSAGTPLMQAFMAQMAIEAGDIERANKLMDALPPEARSPYFDMIRGVIAAARGQNEQAIALLQPFFNRGGENPAARVALSRAYWATGGQAQAWGILKPLADAANAGPAILTLAVEQTSALKLPAAQAYRARLANASRPDPIAKDMQAADAAIAAGDWAKADKIYQGLIAANAGTDSVILFNNAALARLRMGDKAQAVALARRAQALAPEDPIVTDTLAWCLFNLNGATPEVIALINKAYAAQPGNPEIRSHAQQISRSLSK